MKIFLAIVLFVLAAATVGKYTFVTFVYDRVEPSQTQTELSAVETLSETGGIPPEVLQAMAEKSDYILVRMPTPMAEVGTPLEVSGLARGPWFFEGSFPVVVTDWDGLIIGEGYVTAQNDWMTTEFVPFAGTIEFSALPDAPYNRGTVIFQKANPSGLPEHDDALEIPVVFTAE